MKVVTVLPGSHLFGGVKVVLQQAEALRDLGIDAQVVSPDPSPWWYAGASRVYRQCALDAEEIGPCDVAIGTSWNTVPIALAVARRGPRCIAAHLCQCFEALYEPIRDEWPAIEAVYREPTLKLAVSPHLVDLVEDATGHLCHWIPQPLDDTFHPPAPPRAASEHSAADDGFRILVTGQWALDVKGVERTLRALRPLVEENPRLRLVRLSQDSDDAELAFWPEAERHLGIPPHEVPDVVRSVDLFIGPSSEVEGFGLPTLEAMACGRPAVLTDIGAHRALDPAQEASLRVPVEDPEALRRAVRRLRDDPSVRRRLGAAGRRIADGFSPERTGRALADVLRRAVSAGPGALPELVPPRQSSSRSRA